MKRPAIWKSATTSASAEYTGCGWRMTASAATTATAPSRKKRISPGPMVIARRG
jgi:hypothetical protein